MKRLIEWLTGQGGRGHDAGDLHPFRADQVGDCDVVLVLFEGAGGVIIQGSAPDGTSRLVKVWPGVSKDAADRQALEQYADRMRVAPGGALRVLDSGLSAEGYYYAVQEWAGAPMSQHQTLHRFRPDETEIRLELFASILSTMKDLEAVHLAPSHLTTDQIFQERSGAIRIDPIGAPYPPPHRHRRLRKKGIDELHLLRWPAPPEAMQDRALDARGAVWCLGYLGFELLCGSPPFSGIDRTLISMALLLETPPPLRQINPQAPAALENLISRMLARLPSMRPENATACWQEVDKIIRALA